MDDGPWDEATAHREAAARLVDKMMDENELLIDKVNEQARRLEKHRLDHLEAEKKLRDVLEGGGGGGGEGDGGNHPHHPHQQHHAPRTVPGSPKRTQRAMPSAADEFGAGAAAGSEARAAAGDGADESSTRPSDSIPENDSAHGDDDGGGGGGGGGGGETEGKINRVSTQQRFDELPPTSPIGAAALKGGGRRLSNDSRRPAPVEQRPRGLWAFISGGDKAPPYGVPGATSSPPPRR